MNATTEATQTAIENDEDKFTLQDVERRFFAPTELSDGQTYIQQVLEVAPAGNLKWNFNPDDGIPEGYGVAVIPLNERVADRGTVTKGASIAAVPTVDAIAAAEGGAAWIESTIQRALLNAIANAVRSGANSIPFSIADFISTSRGEGMAAFRKLATLYCRALRKKGLKIMNPALLRQVLASAEFAQTHFPPIDQSRWEFVLESMIVHAKKENLDPGILTYWKDTRNEMSAVINDIDVSDLDAMIDA